MKKILSIVLSSVMIGMLLSGCTAQSVYQTNDSLTIYFAKTGNNEKDPIYSIDDFAQTLISRFKQDHHGIEVKLYNPENGSSEITEEQIDQIFSNDMMTGKGPDIVITNASIRIYKMMKGGAFLDLLPLMESDEAFDLQNYQQIMLDAGKLNGKQYIMPISCSIPYLLTMKSTLDDSGFDLSSCDNPQNYVKEAVTLMEKEGGLRIDSSSAQDRAAYMGWATDVVNIASAQLTLDTPDFRSFQELQKAIYQFDHQSGRRPVENSTISQVARNEAVFFIAGGNMINVNSAIKRFAHYSTPVVALSKSSNEEVVGSLKKVAAIGANSSNQQLAYDFIKMFVDHFYKNDSYNEIPLSYVTRQEAIGITQAEEERLSSYPHIVVDAEGKEIDSFLPEPYEEKIKPFVEKIYAFANELDKVILTPDILIKANEYFEPYYQNKDSYENCLKTAQEQLAIYLSE